MTTTFPVRIDSVPAQAHESRRVAKTAYLAVIGVGLLLGLWGLAGMTAAFVLAFGMLVAAVVTILVRPIVGVFVVAFFTVMADGSTMEWYPFTLNFSSAQSILYLDPSLTFTPLEVCFVATVVGAFLRAAGARRWRLGGRPLLVPLLVFAGFVFVGILYGVGLRGGDRTAAFWEFRPLLYLVATFVLASTLLTRTVHYVRLAQVVVLSVLIQSILAIWFFIDLPDYEKARMESLTDHTASVLYAWVVLLVMALWILRKCTWPFRLLTTAAALPIVVVLVISQRRAAMVGLAAAFIVFTIVLFFRRRKAFLVIVPVAAVLTLGYSAAFWNSTSGIAIGAQAIKSVVAPDALSEKDASSDLYREIENFNLAYTVRAEKLTGVGFGRPFYRPVPMPNISFFVFHEFIPHNSIMWIWLKMGYFGFVTMLFGIAVTVRAGIRAALRLPLGDPLAVTVAALLFVAMFVVFAFVDIAWTPQPSVMLGVCMATCVNMVRLAKREGATLLDYERPSSRGPAGRLPISRPDRPRTPEDDHPRPEPLGSPERHPVPL